MRRPLLLVMAQFVAVSLALSGCASPSPAGSPSQQGALEATIRWEPEAPRVDEEVRLTGEVTGPPGDPLDRIEWDVAGQSRRGTEVVHRFGSEGDHRVSFVAHTESGRTVETHATVPVRATEGPPSPSPSPSPSGPPSPDPSTDPSNDPSPAPGPAAGTLPVIVAVLDTGIRADHEAFAEGQVVAWHDFGRASDMGVPETLWDPATEPYDDNGHGTAVASLVGGTGSHTPSHAPGVQLAVAKISDSFGAAAWDDVARAMQWATDVVGADIISLSFYTYMPDPSAPLGSHPLLSSLDRARGQGTLPVVLAGNGAGNVGVPTMSWMHPPATSRSALVVGGASSSGSAQAPLGSMDPEVTALYSAKYACPSDPTCYAQGSGTSFSTPLVAGMAAHLLEVARAEGLEEPDPDRLERLLKGSAADTLAPPTFEGHGFLDAAALARALDHLRAGTTPGLDPVNELYVETVGATMRDGWGG